MYRTYITVILICIVLTSSAQQTSPAWGWAKTFTGSGTEQCWDIAADSRNSVYSYGTFTSDTLHISSQQLIAPGGGLFLLRHDTLGNLIWAQRFGNASVNSPSVGAITTDINGQVLITGSFSGTISFGSFTLTSAGGTDVFVVKIRPDGSTAWARQFSGTLDDTGGPVATDNQGRIFTAGNFSSSNFTIGSTVLSQPNSVKIYYCALDSNGNHLWAQATSSAANCRIYDIAVLTSGNIIMGGDLESGGNLTFSPIVGIYMFTSYHSTYVVKLANTGSFISERLTGGSNRYFSGGLATNKQQQILEAGFSTFLSTNPPIASVLLRDTASYAGITSASASRLSPAGPTTASDVIVDKQSMVTVLASNIGNNSFGSGLTLNTPALVAVLWELDSVLVTRALLATNYQPGIDAYFRKLAKDTLTGSLYMAGYIDAFNAGGNYIIGSNILPHNVGKDASIVQVRKLNAALTLRAFAGNDAVICQGQSAAIGNSTGATGGVAPFTYSWSPTTGVANPTAALTTAAPTVATQYVLAVTDFAGNTVKDTVLVSVTSRVNLGPDTTVYHQCYGDSTNLLTLYNTTGLTALWNTANPGAVPPGNYRLIATNATGCPDTAFAKIVLEVATWTGNVSANWHTAGNWSTGKVPSAITHVIIAPTSANNCEVSAANGVAASLQVRNGGALVLLNGMTVIITGSCLVLPP